MEIQTIQGKSYDVIVTGGGIGGIAAAVSAARQGCSVLLIEKGINLGGLATVGLISWYEPLCDGEGGQMIGGIAEELIRLAAKVGFHTLPEQWGGKDPCPPTKNRFASFFSPTIFSLALDKYVTEAGVSLLFDTRATYPVMDGNVCRGVIVENVDGRVLYPAKAVIDATGDATLLHRAGIPCELGENYFTYVVHQYSYAGAERYLKTKDNRKFRQWKNYGGSDMEGNGQPEGMKPVHGVSAEENTDFLLKAKLKTLKQIEEVDKREYDIMMLPAMPQFRKIRRICGKTVFDGTAEGVAVLDSIGSTGDFRHSNRRFDIPYGTLFHPDFPNLLAAGRIISAGDDGWEITRVIPVCALTGQAAGVAAALSIKEGCSVNDLPYPTLRTALEREKVLFALDQ